MLFAVYAPDIVRLLVVFLIVAAVAAIVWVIVTKGFGIAVPPWVVQILWIVVAAAIGIMAIYLVVSLLSLSP